MGETLPRQPTPQLPRPTVTSPPTSGRRPSSQSLPTRSSQTSWQRTTAPLVFKSRKPGLTNQLKMKADFQEKKINIVVKFSELLAQSCSAHNCESGINPGHSRTLPALIISGHS